MRITQPGSVEKTRDHVQNEEMSNSYNILKIVSVMIILQNKSQAGSSSYTLITLKYISHMKLFTNTCTSAYAMELIYEIIFDKVIRNVVTAYLVKTGVELSRIVDSLMNDLLSSMKSPE